MRPGTHDQAVVIVGSLVFDGLVGTQGAKHVFCIKPTSNHQGCRFDVPEVWPDIPGLPVIVVSTMLQVLVPDFCFSVKEIFPIGVFNRAEIKKEFVRVYTMGIKNFFIVCPGVNPVPSK